MASEALLVESVPVSQSLFTTGIVQPRRPRVDFGGTLIDLVDRTVAVDRIRDMLRSGISHQVVTVNLDFLSIAARDARFQQTINTADLAVPDGMPLVWLSRLKGQPMAERVAGVDLVEDCCQIAADMGAGVFLLGAGPGVAEEAAIEMERRHPGLKVVGTYTPPMGALDERENARMVQLVRNAAPGFLFVALGAPRQDLWIHDHLSKLDVPVSMGVGCVLDLLAGGVTRAPAWMQASGLEWAYRLAQEPARLWRRYLLQDMPMLARLLFDSTHPNEGRAEGDADPAVALL